MDEAFTKLKQVTGVKNVEEMHEKFSNQKSNKLQLELEVKDAEHRLAAAKKAYAKQEALFQELKSSGSGMTELNRESINKCVSVDSDSFGVPCLLTVRLLLTAVSRSVPLAGSRRHSQRRATTRSLFARTRSALQASW